MNLMDFIDIVEANGKSVRAYRECARIAKEEMQKTPEHASTLFVLGIAAQRFVESYDDQPLDRASAANAFERYSSFVKKLATVGNSAEERLTALNEVSMALIEEEI